MANYSTINKFTACSDNPWLQQQQNDQQQRPSCFVPASSFNPHNRTRLHDVEIASLQEIITNPYFGKDQNLCIDTVALLPPFFNEIAAKKANPQTWNPPVLDIHKFMAKTLPHPLNNSGPGLVAGWWWSSIVNDTAETVSFINAIEESCTREICLNFRAVGDTDISGIGMLVSTGMLILLSLVFSLPASFGLKRLLQRRRTKSDMLPEAEAGSMHNSDRQRESLFRRLRFALVDTLDDLLSAIIIFTLSVLIAALVLRRQNVFLFDIFMAEALSLICNFALVMVASAQWATYYGRHARPKAREKTPLTRPTVVEKPIKLWTLLGVAAIVLLTIILFAIEFESQHATWVMGGVPLERRCLEPILGGQDVDNLGRKRVIFPLCFCLWLAALIASFSHLPWARKWWELRREKAHVKGQSRRGVDLAWRTLGLLPMVLGTVGIILLCAMYYSTYQQMKSAYGVSFSERTKEWGFGQYLALATWVPPFLQLLHSFFDKSKV